MDIIEQLAEISRENELRDSINEELTYKMKTRTWKVYYYLKGQCVGENNKQQAETIVKALKESHYELFSDDYDKRALRSDIRKIRTTLPRRIGSSASGYWLMTTDDEQKGTQLLEKQFISLTETLINLGVDPKLLHEVVGALGRKRGKLVDNQGTLPIGKYLREVIHLYSDDLEKENE